MGRQAGCRVDPADGQRPGSKAVGREGLVSGLRTRSGALTLGKRPEARQKLSVWGLRNSQTGMHRNWPGGKVEGCSRNQEGPSH